MTTTSIRRAYQSYQSAEKARKLSLRRTNRFGRVYDARPTPGNYAAYQVAYAAAEAAYAAWLVATGR